MISVIILNSQKNKKKIPLSKSRDFPKFTAQAARAQHLSASKDP